MWHRIGKHGNKYWGKRGAGIVFTDGHTILLLRRSGKGDNSGLWGMPGGKSEDGETFLGTAQRETAEEIGHFPRGCKRVCHIDSQDGKHQFRTYICKVSCPFECQLNDEHDDYDWFDIDDLDVPLHEKLGMVIKDIVREIKKSYGQHLEESMSGFAGTLNFSEILGATSVVYTGEKEGADWQYEGAPQSMNPQRKKKKKKKKR